MDRGVGYENKDRDCIDGMVQYTVFNDFFTFAAV